MGKITGQLLHMIQDSYSKAHTVRNNISGKIEGYQSYGAQDTHKHGKEDSASGNYEEIVEKLPSASIAMSRSETKLRAIFEFDCKSKDYSKFDAIFNRIFDSHFERILYPNEWQTNKEFTDKKYGK